MINIQAGFVQDRLELAILNLDCREQANTLTEVSVDASSLDTLAKRQMIFRYFPENGIPVTCPAQRPSALPVCREPRAWGGKLIKT